MLSLTVVPGAAMAEDEVIERVVVRNRLFDVGGRLELSPSVGVMLMTRLTDHYTLSGDAAFNIFNTLAVEARASIAYTRQTGLAHRIAQQFLERDPSLGIERADDLSDAWQMRTNVMAGLRWQPIYGKISLLAEMPVHFQAYVSANGGVGSFHRQSLVYCRALLSRDDGTCADWLTEDKLSPVVSGALGIRFFTHQQGSIRFEVRDYAFQDSYLVNIDRTVAEAGGTTGEQARAGFTHLVLFDVGYAFLF
ncbi:MAG TPA: outer membrane beta-barrel domain-containing protein [Myxococcaceae bacterium]|nr:outer membrane beta-barrel domain-containing protein [Myxococcaceae bacterium]